MLQTLIDRLGRHDELNFQVTNRVPRRLATRAMGWFARIEHPLVARLSIRALELFAGDLRLHEARQSHFRSLRECFTRELAPGARPIDRTPGVLVSPCDGIVVACGRVEDTTLIQAKGHRYTLAELLHDDALVERHRNGSYVTLRLTAAMYHRFHAPTDARVDAVRFIPGDTWNVNPPTLARVDRVYCRNTRAVVPLRVDGCGLAITLVPVGAVLVSSIQLACLQGAPLQPGLNAAGGRVVRGQEMGHFEHGSTIVALATPGVILHDAVTEGAVLRVGQPLWAVAPVPA
jgi:phosphatidylserine decarboxylase